MRNRVLTISGAPDAPSNACCGSARTAPVFVGQGAVNTSSSSRGDSVIPFSLVQWSVAPFGHVRFF